MHSWNNQFFFRINKPKKSIRIFIFIFLKMRYEFAVVFLQSSFVFNCCIKNSQFYFVLIFSIELDWNLTASLRTTKLCWFNAHVPGFQKVQCVYKSVLLNSDIKNMHSPQKPSYLCTLFVIIIKKIIRRKRWAKKQWNCKI